MIKSKFKYIAALIAVVISVFSLWSGGAQFASAAASSYSDVLEDLAVDKNFNIEEYPATSGDYGLYVKQIAETTGGELLIYVYQPAARQDIKACTINIAREKDDSKGLGFKDYNLEYLNNNGVFFKYRVLDFEIKADALRYYNISNILRPYDKIIDGSAGAGQTVTEVPYRVGQFWTACTVAGEVSYTMTESEVIEIKDKVVGYINYDEGFDFGFTSTNSATSTHFVAFSTNKQIDKLISASIRFDEQAVTYQLCANGAHNNTLNGHSYKDKFNYQYGDKKPHEPDPLNIKYSDVVLDVGKGNYSWDRIRTASQFISDTESQDVKFTTGGSESLKCTQWVLNFYETPIELKTTGGEWATAINIFAALINGVNDLDCRYTQVSDVMLLQLEFETDGQYYNLGVVDNKQTGSFFGSDANSSFDFWQWIADLFGVDVATAKGIFAAIIVLIALAIAMPVLSIVFPSFRNALKKFFKGLGLVFYWLVYGFWWFISAPFKAIANAVKKRKATAATSASKSKSKRAKNKHMRGATGKRKPKTTKKRGGKK